ncbi:leucine-rich repeat domain-containing protein, partial [Mycoplasma sp. VS410B]|uniref:leucine-rich repeat domain-containing protein n=1 Tax=Mycoplasma sp. VS410B TaxID=3401688 RepID=UPI003AB09510
MKKAGKFLLVVVGGLAIGSAVVAIPSVVYHNQRNYQDQKAKLQQAEANIKYEVISSINKAQTLASNITKNEIIFSGYDKELFDIDLVDISTPINAKLSLTPGKSNEITTKTIQYFNANNTSGTLEFKFIVRSKRYADLSVVKNGTITGFLKTNPVVPITKTAKESADAIIPTIMAAYNTILQNKTLKPEQVNAINNYATQVANGLAKENLAVLQAVEKSLPNSQFDTVSALYRTVALNLNDVLADILNNAIQNKTTTSGIEQVKTYLSAEKMLSIKNTIADILISKATEIANVGQEIFNSLKVNETTKNIEVLDSFINGMSQFFNSEITTLANKIKQVQIVSDSSQMQAIKQLKAFLPELKSAAVAKAHELLPQAANYEAIKAVLKPQYEALEASIQANVALLINETKALASLIDTLNLSPKIDTPVVTPGVNSDITTFVYDDGNKKTEIKYDNNAKKLIFPDAEVITEPMFNYAFRQLENSIKPGEDNITLSCPETKVIPGTIDTKIIISKLELPKIEKVVNKNGSSMFRNRLSRNLEDNKVVQNGILFKWNNPIGEMKDSTITQIVPFAINQTADVTGIDLPNLENADFSAFGHPNNGLRTIFPQINSKIVLNGILIKWPGATGQIEDSEVTNIASYVFKNNQNITSVSFPNVTSIGDSTFEGATNLTSVSLPNVTSIGYHAFEGATNLTSVSFPNATSIEASAFEGATNLTSVSFPNVTSIGNSAFEGATNLTSVSFPNVTSVGNSAFKGATNLTSVNIPKLNKVGFQAFENTPKLNKLICNGILIKWSDASGYIIDDSIT